MPSFHHEKENAETTFYNNTHEGMRMTLMEEKKLRFLITQSASKLKVKNSEVLTTNSKTIFLDEIKNRNNFFSLSHNFVKNLICPKIRFLLRNLGAEMLGIQPNLDIKPTILQSPYAGEILHLFLDRGRSLRLNLFETKRRHVF